MTIRKTPVSDDKDNTLRVVRGGSWSVSVPSGVRAAHRIWFAVSTRSYNLGFRCALRGRAARA